MCQLDQSIFNLRVLGGMFYIFIQILKEASVSGEPDQKPRFAASGLVLHGLPMSHKKTIGLKHHS